jgi:hypothetical protein
MYQPLFSRILKEDLGKDAPKWTDRLIYQMNLITDYLKAGFAKGITIQDNLINPIKQIQVNATGTPSSDTLSFAVTLPSGYQPKGVQILNCTDLSGAIVGAAVWAEMLPGLQNGNVVIRAIYGLTAGHQYSITFLVY